MSIPASTPWGGFERLSSERRSPLPDPRRAEDARLQREIELASASPIVTAVLETADAILLVLNAERQIVAFNSRVPALAGVGDVRGLRPGEAFGCVNASGPGGCGAAPACSACGALGAILVCQARRMPIEAECSIRSEGRGGSTFEFNARAVPVTIDGSALTVLSLRDVSAEKRRQVLEQLFFHDVLNTVAGLCNWATLLQDPRREPRVAAERIRILSRQIERHLKHHRSLALAENGALVPEWSTFRTREVLEEVRAVCSEHPSAQERSIEVAPELPDCELRSDRFLLLRTLVNAVCNGLEASSPGATVRIWSEQAEGGVRFLIQNPGVMPQDVQARVFQRSFSTKAASGRGLGTYSMKLFGERWLGGRVSFTSGAQAGTVFSVWLPGAPREASVRP